MFSGLKQILEEEDVLCWLETPSKGFVLAMFFGDLLLKVLLELFCKNDFNLNQSQSLNEFEHQNLLTPNVMEKNAKDL